jgi:hypothetical protein
MRYAGDNLRRLMAHIMAHQLDLSCLVLPPSAAYAVGSKEAEFEALATSCVSPLIGLFSLCPVTSSTSHVFALIGRAAAEAGFVPPSHPHSAGMDHPVFCIWTLIMFRSTVANHVYSALLRAYASVSVECIPLPDGADGEPAVLPATATVDPAALQPLPGAPDAKVALATLPSLFGAPTAEAPPVVPPKPAAALLRQFTDARHCYALARATTMRAFDLGYTPEDKAAFFLDALKARSLSPRTVLPVLAALDVWPLIDVPAAMDWFSNMASSDNGTQLVSALTSFYDAITPADKANFQAVMVPKYVQQLVSRHNTKPALTLLRHLNREISEFPNLEFELASKTMGHLVFSRRAMEFAHNVTAGGQHRLLLALISRLERDSQIYEAVEIARRYNINIPRQLPRLHQLVLADPHLVHPSQSEELRDMQGTFDSRFLQLPKDIRIVFVDEPALATAFAEHATAAVERAEAKAAEYDAKLAGAAAAAAAAAAATTAPAAVALATADEGTTAVAAAATAAAAPGTSAGPAPAPAVATPASAAAAGVLSTAAAMLESRYPLLVGLDTESSISFIGPSQQPVLMQVAFEDTAYLIDLQCAAMAAPAMREPVDSALLALFTCRRALKLGQSFAEDMSQLAAAHPTMRAFRRCAPLLCVGTLLRAALPDAIPRKSAAPPAGTKGNNKIDGKNNSNSKRGGNDDAADRSNSNDSGTAAQAATAVNTTDFAELTATAALASPTSDTHAALPSDFGSRADARSGAASPVPALGAGASVGAGAGAGGGDEGNEDDEEETVAEDPAAVAAAERAVFLKTARAAVVSLTAAAEGGALALRDVSAEQALAAVGHLRAPVGLAAVVKFVMNIELFKGQQVSDWTRRPLTVYQTQYAAIDAWVLPPLMRELAAVLQARLSGGDCGGADSGAGLAWLFVAACARTVTAGAPKSAADV